MIGIRSAFSIKARGQWPHLEAVYMTAPRSLAETPRKLLPRGGRPYMTRGGFVESAPLRQPAHHLVELFEVAIADLDGATGVAVVDGHSETECIADPLFQRDCVGIL